MARREMDACVRHFPTSGGLESQHIYTSYLKMMGSLR